MKRCVSSLMALAVLSASLLSGCATGYLLDNDVQSFSSLSVLPAQPNYRFDRLPSQQGSPAHDQLEQLAAPALFKAGLRRDDATPLFGVELGARVERVLSPWFGSWDSWGWGRFPHRTRWGVNLGFPNMESPWYHREATVIVRDLASNRVVYESSAVNDSPLMDDPSVFPAMFGAALSGFPNPPRGLRRVDVGVGN